jgi:glycosyltransferase involved in cell wall biosynthesis
MYDYVIVTHIPVFYKVNLYNELAKKLNVFVIFISEDTKEKRADDFINLKNIHFKYDILSDGNFQDRNKYKNIKKLSKILKNIEYKKLLVSGWDLQEFWYLIFTNAKYKNCLALESTILESNTGGINGLIKKIFLKRISTVFASGDLHKQLLVKLGYNEKINITKGVGIINKPDFEKIAKEYSKKFLYIGRLAKVKNLEVLITIFNDLSDYTLTIIGVGEYEEYLKSIANKNTIFKGSVENRYIENFMLENDIFILPSISESWGLVIEEALYFGMPIIVSKNCGSVELVENGVNGYIINPNNNKNIKENILKIDNDNYKKLVDGVERFSIYNKDKIQVTSYNL